MIRARLPFASVLLAALVAGPGCPKPAVNTAPTATDQSVTLDEDATLAITLAGDDADGDTLTFALVSQPLNGTLTGDGASVTYAPDADFNGTDSFTFTVSDAEATSAEATVSITVNPVNDAPVANAATGTTDEDAAVTIALSGSDVEEDSLTFTVGTAPTSGTATVTGSNVEYVPSADTYGEDTFTIVANDGTADSAPATVTVTVNPVNDAPTATSDTASTDEDTPVDLTLVGADIDGDNLTYAVTVQPTNGTLTGTPPAVTYDPNGDYNGADQFTFTVSDGVETATGTWDLTVNAVNDAPVIDAGTDGAGLVGQSLTLTRTGSDIESGTALTWSWTQTGGPTAPIADAAANDTTFRPWAAGVYTFEVTASDGDLSDTATLTIPVADVAGGGAHSVHVKSDGTLWSWGMNDTTDGGALGDGTRDDRPTAVQVLGADGSTFDSDWAAVSGGDAHTLALKTDGTLWGWGSNAQGAVGTGTASDKPVKVGTDTDWRMVAAGSNFSLALKSDGSLWGWGIGTQGQLADACVIGSTCTAKSAPASSDTAGGWVKIVAGDGHAAGLKSDGTLWTWGRGTEGQLGQGCSPEVDCTHLTTPTKVGTDTDWTDVAVGQDVTVAIKGAGEVFAFGSGASGALGSQIFEIPNGPIPAAVGSPRAVCAVDTPSPCSTHLGGVVKVAVADTTGLGLTSSGDVVGWGASGTSLLSGTSQDQMVPTTVLTGKTWLGLVAGRSHALAIDDQLNVVGWGTNTTGQIGDGSAFSNAPIPFGTFAAVSTLGNHVLGVKTDGTLWTWGNDSGMGELGDGSRSMQMAPVPVCADWDLTNSVCLADLTGVSTAIDAGLAHSQVLLTNGQRWAWGKNNAGQLGIGNNQSPWWYALEAEKNSTAYPDWNRVLAAPGSFSVGLQDDGAGSRTLWTWGSGSFGTLGDGCTFGLDCGNRLDPAMVGTDTDWQDFAAGQHVLATKSNGELWAWGRNDQGLVGDGSSNIIVTSPVQVCATYNTGTSSCDAAFTGVRTVAATGSVSVAVKTDDTVWTWGPNSKGQLGDGGQVAGIAGTPVQVCAVGASAPCSTFLGNIEKVSASANHVVALGKDGALYAWGQGTYGELGNGTYASSNVPVAVLGLDGGAPETDWVDVDAGNGFTIGRKADGTIYAWGSNLNGTFGLGRGPIVTTPTPVIGF